MKHKKLVGVTDGLWCTQVVQQALANAGVSDAYQLWPDQYAGQYGYYTNDPQVGDLLYYNNGGRGVDHIAIYIGNGQVVHGNYEGKTVIASAYLSTQDLHNLFVLLDNFKLLAWLLARLFLYNKILYCII